MQLTGTPRRLRDLVPTHAPGAGSLLVHVNTTSLFRALTVAECSHRTNLPSGHSLRFLFPASECETDHGVKETS